jgi:hypothetical protein
MGYASLQNNQAVTAANIQDAIDIGVFTAAGIFPVTLKCVTKGDASLYINIDTSYAPYAAKASNQLVVKSDLKPIFQNTGTLFYDSFFKVELIGWASSTTACTSYGSNAITIYWNGTLGIGTLIFVAGYGTFSNYFIIVDASFNVYYVTINEFIYYDTAVGAYACTIASIGTCVFGTSWQARYSTVFGDVCSQIDQTVYTSGTFTTGDTVYTDISLTSPLVGYNYISENLSGTIWNIDSGTGVIGSSTFTTC